MVKLLFLSGSARKDSCNAKLAKVAANIAEKEGADAKFIDLNDYEMPLYHGDLEVENGMPEAAIRLKKEFIEADGFFIASPEYNSSFSPLLKNTIDWMSRPNEENEPMLAAYTGKVAAISAASPGALGGLRGLVPLRMLLGNIGVLVVPNQFALSGAYGAFDEHGNLKDEKQYTSLEKVVKQLVEVAKRQS